MKTLFADTGYGIALLVKTDDLHATAIASHRELRGCRILTTDLVLVELLNDLSGRGSYLRNAGVELVEGWTIRGNDHTIPVSDGLFADTLARYGARRDKSWSFTDCASMVVCDQEGISEVLTYDHHFQQAGFTALLRD